ncbi:hypothetical protein IWQ48_003823 [Labrenzia sp. EL_13]|nr:hypothetical protein [Labrenzia sp. EL_13]
MARQTMKQRFEFDVLTDPVERTAYLMLDIMAMDGHGDVGSCGVAEFDLLNFSDALGEPPGETLQLIKRVGEAIQAVCVEHENTVLFAMAGANQRNFSHLYTSRGFEGLPPNLPQVQPRHFRL